MTTKARHAEADAVSEAFHIALTQIGVETVQEALKLWDEVPPVQRASTASSWLAKAIQLVMGRRARSRELARAYYRLARALRTGTTIADPYHPEPEYVSLNDLRDEFAALTTGELPARPQAGPADATPTESSDEPAASAEDEQDDDGADAEADRILVEELDGLAEEEARLEAEAQREIEIDLAALGTDNLNRKVGEIDTELSADDVDRLRDEAHSKAGARQAAAAERIAMDGARSAIWKYASKDKRALGYARLSRTGTPCGWCAMLISRGAVYRSEASASYSDGDLYHDNCHCYAVPIFTREQYDQSDLFALNREYSELWPTVTKGLSGKAALRAWRYFIRQEQAARRRAQVA